MALRNRIVIVMFTGYPNGSSPSRSQLGPAEVHRSGAIFVGQGSAILLMGQSCPILLALHGGVAEFFPRLDVEDLRLASTDLLATDDILHEFEVRPGDPLLVLGFPFGAEANDLESPGI
jgi:hypothetical protein